MDNLSYESVVVTGKLSDHKCSSIQEKEAQLVQGIANRPLVHE